MWLFSLNYIYILVWPGLLRVRLPKLGFRMAEFFWLTKIHDDLDKKDGNLKSQLNSVPATLRVREIRLRESSQVWLTTFISKDLIKKTGKTAQRPAPGRGQPFGVPGKEALNFRRWWHGCADSKWLCGARWNMNKMVYDPWGVEVASASREFAYRSLRYLR